MTSIQVMCILKKVDGMRITLAQEVAALKNIRGTQTLYTFNENAILF